MSAFRQTVPYVTAPAGMGRTASLVEPSVWSPTEFWVVWCRMQDDLPDFGDDSDDCDVSPARGIQQVGVEGA